MIEDRIKLQSQLYPWILLSVLNWKLQNRETAVGSRKRFPKIPVSITSRDSDQEVRWDPLAAEVDIRPKPAEKEKGIGFSFAKRKSLIRFFEGGSVNPFTMRRLHHLLSWKRLLKHLVIVQKELGSADWEQAGDEQLLAKTLTTLYSAVAGLNGLSLLDPFTANLMRRLPEGVIRIYIGGIEGQVASLGIREGSLSWLRPGDALDGEGYSVDFTFKDIHTAWKCVANLTDNLAAVGRGDIKLRGYIPLADGFNHMLDRLQMFVKAG